MLNHARTLLLNQPASRYNGMDADYVPADYLPIVLPASLKAIYNTIFPSGINAYAELDIVRAWLPILHCPELVSFTLDLDSRLTYDAYAYNLNGFGMIDTNVTIACSSTCDMTPRQNVVNNVTNIPYGDAGKHIWTFRTNTANTSYLDYPDGTTDTVTMVPIGNTRKVTSNIPLYADRVTAYFSIPSRTLTGVYNINYTVLLHCTYDMIACFTKLSTLAANALLLEQLFKPYAGYTDSINSLRTAWASSPELTIKYGALVLAYLYQCDRLRVQRGGI